MRQMRIGLPPIHLVAHLAGTNKKGNASQRLDFVHYLSFAHGEEVLTQHMMSTNNHGWGTARRMAALSCDLNYRIMCNTVRYTFSTMIPV